MKIISVLNHKGGVGKTTSTSNIAGALKMLGKKVLVIDVDPQANLTMSLGLREKYDKNIYGALSKKYDLPILTNVDGIDVVPSTLDLVGAEIELLQAHGREFRLRRLLEPIKNKYDFILIDCPPNLGVLTSNALTASDGIIVPVEAAYFAMEGLAKLLEVIDLVKDSTNPDLQLYAILVTKYDTRTYLDKNIADNVSKNFADKIIKTYIRKNIAIGEAQVIGRDILSYKKRSIGAIDYLAATKDLLKMLKK